MATLTAVWSSNRNTAPLTIPIRSPSTSPKPMIYFRNQLPPPSPRLGRLPSPFTRAVHCSVFRPFEPIKKVCPWFQGVIVPGSLHRDAREQGRGETGLGELPAVGSAFWAFPRVQTFGAAQDSRRPSLNPCRKTAARTASLIRSDDDEAMTIERATTSPDIGTPVYFVQTDGVPPCFRNVSRIASLTTSGSISFRSSKSTKSCSLGL